jgi:hypothetical protein
MFVTMLVEVQIAAMEGRNIGGQTCHGDIIELLDVSVYKVLRLLEAWK